MARSKPTSSRTAPPRPFAPLRPYVRPTALLPPSNRLSPATAHVANISDTVRQPNNPGYHEHGRIREHDQSTRSLATSLSTTSGSDVSAKLARNRHLSTIMTPTNSEAAYSEGGTSISHGSSNMVGYTPGIAHRSRRRILDHVTSSIDESLLGLVPSQLEAVPEVELVRSRPSPEQVLHQSHSPWSGLHRSTSSEPSSISSPAQTRRGGRTGGLGKKAKKVSAMRQKQACLRCHMYRIECDDGDPCVPCCRRMRTWGLACTRQRLPERLCHLLPEILVAHLEWKRVRDFMESNSEGYISPPFHIPLTQFLGEAKPMWLQVREVEPLDHENPILLQRPVFSVTEGHVDMVQSESPPILPYFGEKPAEVQRGSDQIAGDLMRWLRGIKHAEKSIWPWYVFDTDAQIWERNVLRLVCSLHDPTSEEHIPLDGALDLTFFNYMLIHSFAVPTDHIEKLYARLQHPDFKMHNPAAEVCPRAVDVFLNWIIMQKFELQSKQTLEHLGELFRSRISSVTVGQLAFCESFLFLIVLGQLQISVLQHSILDRAEGQTRFTGEDARQQIRKMEDELAKPVIELCLFKLRKCLKAVKTSANVDQQEDVDMDRTETTFFDDVQKITELCARTFDIPTDLNNIDDGSFEVTNVGRLLRRFYTSASQVFPPPGPSEVTLDPT